MSPKTKEQFEVIRQRSRENILETALELFARNGYASTSISQIAKAAGVSKGLMYNYFESKEALLHAILTSEMEMGEALWNGAMETAETPFQKLKNATLTMVSIVRNNQEHWKLLTSLAFQPDIMQGMEAVVEEKKRMYIGQMVGLFTEMGVPNPVMETYFYGALMDGIFLHYMNLEKDYPLDDMVGYLLERYEERGGGEK